ncbi:universal stress protein [Kineosporia succinea]|uniref:Nucleotide-binding universal stress UspA family protein n=1 Tax=Kineosporia succinea TaxID=84632 RepID=A0ABT9P253_9ACTN|nr:universal stress protein [Kineosporia succinea]MDP9826759.1 nucleotide-binding universal stress UspA family protein [Kineosporia succinea]
MTTHRIVVGVDGSIQSRQALRWASQLAAATGDTLRAVTAWEFPATYGWAACPADWNPERDAARVLAETVTDALGDRPPVTVEQVVREGNAAKTLIDESRFATLVVVGSRGHGGVAGVLLGSVSAKVAEYASCPALVVHGETVPEENTSRKEGLVEAG